jgi:uncharacterized protein YvpB
MICNYWAEKNNKGVYTTPIKMAKLSAETNGRPGPPCNGTNMYNLAKNGNPILERDFGFRLSSVNANDAEIHVKNGYPVIWCSKKARAKKANGSYKSYSAHFMVVTEFKDNKFLINDPGNSSNRGCVYTENFSDLAIGSSYFFVSKPV